MKAGWHWKEEGKGKQDGKKASGGEVSHLESGFADALFPSFLGAKRISLYV